MKNFSTYLRFVALTTLITLGLGQTWAAAIPANTVIYVDVTNFTGGQSSGYYLSLVTNSTNKGCNVNKDNTSGATNYAPKNDVWTYRSLTHVRGNIYSTTITSAQSDGTKISIWSKDENNYDNIWQVNMAGNITYDGSHNMIVISSGSTYHNDRQSYFFNATWSDYDPCDGMYAPSEVVNGTNVMFYVRSYSGSQLCLTTGSNTPRIDIPYAGTDSYAYANIAKTNLSSYYYVSNNRGGWNGVANNGIKSAKGGELFIANGSVSTTAAKTAATTASVTSETLSISTTCNSATGVYGSKQLYIQYYLDDDFIGVTYSGNTAVCNSIPAATTARASTYNVSSLSNGSHTLKTILTDGIVYYIADTDNFTVAHSYSITYKDQDNVTYTGTNGNSLPASYTYGTGVTLVDGEKSGYTFGGWYENSGCTGSAVTTISTTATGAKTFYAKWTQNATPSVILAVSKSSGVQIGETVTLTPTPSNASSPTYRYRMKKSGGSNGSWQTSNSFTIPSHGTFYFEVEMTSGGTTYYNNGGTSSTIPTNVSLSTVEPALSGANTATIDIGATSSMSLTNATYTTNNATIRHDSGTPNVSYTLGQNYTFTKTGTWTFSVTPQYPASNPTYTKSSAITKTITVRTPTISGFSDANKYVGESITYNPTVSYASSCSIRYTVQAPSASEVTYTKNTAQSLTAAGNYVFRCYVTYNNAEVVTFTATVTVTVKPYYIAGEGALGLEWNPAETAMTYNNDGTYYYTTPSLDANTEYSFKVTNGAWGTTNEIGNGSRDATHSENITFTSEDSGTGNVVFKCDNAGAVTIWCNPSTPAIWIVGTAPVPKTFSVTVPDCTPACYIRGSFNDWGNTAMTRDPNNANHFTLTVNACPDNVEYKYCSGSNNWDYQEQDASGNDLANNRTYNANDVVARWKSKPTDVAYSHTFTVTVPACTPSCYIAGSFNSWNTVAMTMVDATHYTYTVDCTDAATYKYASGNNMSSYYETDASGNGISDRVAVNCAMTDNVVKWHSKPAYPHTFTVTVPSCTPACYFVSDVDDWTFHAMTKVDATHYTYTVTCADDAKYKYASGADWAYVEKDANGDEISDRIASDCAATDAIGTWRTPSFSLTPSSAQSIALPISGTQTATQSITAGSLEGTTAAQITWTLTTTGGAAVPSSDATISPASANATTTLTAKKTGTYRVTCTATNGCTSTSHYVDITATCATPSMTVGQTTFDILASGSQVVGPTSPSGISSYSWTIVSGTGGSFSSTTAQRPTFTPQRSANNTYVLRCTASNACGNSIEQDYIVNAWQTMPKVTLNVTNQSGETEWGSSGTIYAYYWKSAEVNGFVALTWSSGKWTGNIPKSTAELGYRIYICKTQSTESAIRTYDANEYGYVDIPAGIGTENYKTYDLEILPYRDSNSQRYGLQEQCHSFTLTNNTFSLGNNESITLSVTKAASSPNNIPSGATYLWQCIQGTEGDDLIDDATSVTPTFYKTLNGHNASGRYVYRVTVSNPNNSDCFATALITVDAFSGTYYLKHAKGANNTNWGWDNMTHEGNGIYTVSAYYDGDDSNVGAKVSTDKKIRVNAQVYGDDLCSGQSWGATTLHYWDPNNLSDNHDVTSYEKSAYDGYQFIIPEGQSFTLWDEYFDSGNSNTNSHHLGDWAGPVNDDVYFLIKASSAANCYTSYAIYESWASGHSGAEYPDGYVRYDGYRTKDNILGHEHAAGTVIWVYNAVTDELSINSTGTYYRLAATVPSGTGNEKYEFAGTAAKTYYSNGVTTVGNTDASTLSMYVAAGQTITLQSSDNGVSYTDVSPAVTYTGPSTTESGVWVTKLTNTTGSNLSWSKYTGNYYLRSKGVLDDMASYKTNAYSKFTEFEPDRSNVNEFFNHYWASHLEHGENIGAMVANDYNSCLSDELGSYYVGLGNYSANIRYAYDTETNHFSYSLLNGSTAGLNFLTLFGGMNVYNNNTEGKSLLTQSSPEVLADQSNWVYVADIYADQDATVRLLGQYKKDAGSAPKQTWLLGNGNNLTTLPILQDNNTGSILHMLVTYDFKTNKIVVGWIPENDPINNDVTIEGNLIMRRTNNGDVKTFKLANSKNIEGIEKAYFNFILTPYNSTTATDGLSAAQNIYWFSLPFDCKVSDIFGIAGYGTDWVIQRYRGDARAHYSWTSNISTFWRNVGADYTLKAGEGYVMVFKADQITFKSITIDEVTTEQNSIFFPSKEDIGTVTGQTASVTYESMICTAQGGKRKAEDSNWRVIGPVSYDPTVNFSSYDAIGEQVSADGESYPNFLYVFNNPFQKSQGNNNPISAYQVKDGSDFEYRTTYSYMTQFAGTINWATSGTGITNISSAPRRRTETATTPKRESYTLNMASNEGTELDRTIVVLKTGGDADFIPGEDLYKYSEGGKSVVYTEASEKPAAGNSLPYQSQEVPVTVNLAESGDYTFALDGDIDGTTGVQLVDNADGVITDLRQYSYSATLPAGETRGRFTLIFTIDAGQHGGQTTGLTDLYENTLVRVIDGRIVVDGMPAGATLRLYDATGKLIYGAKSQEQGTKNSWQSAPLPQGVYMLRIGNHTTKVVL